MRVVGVVHRQQANIIGRIYDEPLIGIVEYVFRVEAYPYFRERLTDGWYQDIPRFLRYRFRFFHPADINAFERFNLRRVVFDAIEHEFSIRSEMTDH